MMRRARAISSSLVILFMIHGERLGPPGCVLADRCDRWLGGVGFLGRLDQEPVFDFFLLAHQVFPELANVMSEASGKLQLDFADFHHHGVVVHGFSISSSGVQITGISYPRLEHMSRRSFIFVALAMCLKFQVSR
jgi:hypothetical protein